jgi:hypothetical protein
MVTAQLHVLAALHLVPNEKEAGWAPEVVWTNWRIDKWEWNHNSCTIQSIAWSIYRWFTKDLTELQ